MVSAQATKHQIRVGHGRLDTAAVVTSWTGRSTSARWTDIERSGRIQPGDAATACAHRIDIDLRGAQRKAVDGVVARLARREVMDEGHVSAGSSHIARNEIPESRRRADKHHR